MENATMYEVLQLAIHLEEEGQKFYESYAEKASGQVKDAFKGLALDELKHARFFKSLYYDLKEKPGMDYLFEEEVEATFKEYAVSAALTRETAKVETVKEAIEEAIVTEQRSIDYYEYLYKVALDETKETLKTIIDEEKKHKVVLEKLKLLV